MNESNKTYLLWASVGTILVLLITIGFFLFWEYEEQREVEIRELQANETATQVATELFQRALSCQPIPIGVENRTINLIAIECLR